MNPEFGNAGACGTATRGWSAGHFVRENSLRSTRDLEIKWGAHKMGERSDWKSQHGKKTVSILISGRFAIAFKTAGGVTHILKEQGDFVIWDESDEHRWDALADSVVLTVRWPSAA